MVPMDPNGDAMVMCIDAIKKPMSFNDQKPTTFFFHVFFTRLFFLNDTSAKPPRFGKLKRCIWTSPWKAMLFEKHMKGTIKVPTKRTKRQNDTHFLNCFTGSQPRGEVSLKFVDRRSDVFFVPTFWREIPVDDMISGLSGLDNLDSWKPK